MSRFLPATLLTIALAAFVPAQAQSTKHASIILEIEAVPASEGSIRASLCDDPTADLPGPCLTYAAEATAVAGTTTLTFENIKPGRYALQFWHDANGNGRPEIPPEGYGYGNNAIWPPSFDSTAIDVTSDMTLQLQLRNVMDQFSPATPITSTPTRR